MRFIMKFLGLFKNFNDNIDFTYQYSNNSETEAYNKKYNLDFNTYVVEFCEISGCANRLLAIGGRGHCTNDPVFLVHSFND